MSGSLLLLLLVRVPLAEGWYADSGSKGEDCGCALACGRGVLGPSDGVPSARGFLPVYFRGEGDLNAAGDFAFVLLFFVDPDSFGVA